MRRVDDALRHEFPDVTSPFRIRRVQTCTEIYPLGQAYSYAALSKMNRI